MYINICISVLTHMLYRELEKRHNKLLLSLVKLRNHATMLLILVPLICMMSSFAFVALLYIWVQLPAGR